MTQFSDFQRQLDDLRMVSAMAPDHSAALMEVRKAWAAALPKTARVSTGSIAPGSTALVTVTWPAAFADANYTVSADVLDSTATSLSLSIVHIEAITAGAVNVRVINSALGALTGTLHVTAIHD